MNQLIPHNGLPAGMKRFDLIKLLNPLMSELGLRADDLRYLEYLIGRTLVADFGAEQVCMTWVGVDKIAADLSLSPRTLNRIENRLELLGLIRRVLSPHKKRFGRRDAAKRIVYACGIDLGPLINSAPELLQMLSQQQSNFLQLCTLRTECKELLKHIRSFAQEDALNAAKALLPRLRPSEVGCIDKLQEICARLRAIISKCKNSLRKTAQTAVSDNRDRRITNQEHISLTCSRPENASEQRPKPQAASPIQIAVLASSGLRAAIDLYASGSNERPDAPSWQTLLLAAQDTALSSKIHRQVWQNAVVALGEEYASLAFAIVHRNAERIDTRWHVENVPGAFKELVRKASNSPCCIDRLWGALVHEGGAI